MNKMIGKQVTWAVMGWLGIEWVKGTIIADTPRTGFYRVEGHTLFGHKHSEIKNISELTFC